jgi:hypothetical protein
VPGGVNTLVIFTITVITVAGLDADRQAVDAPHLPLADSLGSSARLADNS